MKKIPLALQVYSVREDAEKDFGAAMQKVKETGYDYVELAGLYGRGAGEIRKLLEGAGVQAVSAHVPFAELERDLSGTLDGYAAIGCRYIAIPYLPEDLRPLTPGFERVMKAIPEIGGACRERGMTLLYHNHDFEFVRMEDGSYALDYLYAHLPAKLLQTELDTCWIKVAGEDPAAYIRKYAGRCPVVHLKDFYKEGNPENLYELIGVEKEPESGASRGRFEFRPVGYGMQVMPEIIEAAAECGAAYLVVEQDASVGRSPMEAVRMSRDYLRPLGI